MGEGFESHPMVLQDYSWRCSQESLLENSGEHNEVEEIESGLVTCKALTDSHYTVTTGHDSKF